MESTDDDENHQRAAYPRPVVSELRRPGYPPTLRLPDRSNNWSCSSTPVTAITVIDGVGHERTGRVVALTPSALALVIDGVRRDFREAQVHVIRQWRPDRLKNGAWFGFAVGAAVGATAFIPKYDIAGRYAAIVPRPAWGSWGGHRRWTRCPGAEPAGHLSFNRDGAARDRGARLLAVDRREPGRSARLLTPPSGYAPVVTLTVTSSVMMKPPNVGVNAVPFLPVVTENYGIRGRRRGSAALRRDTSLADWPLRLTFRAGRLSATISTEPASTISRCPTR